MRSQQSCKSGRQPPQRSEVKSQHAVAEDSTVDVMDEKEPNEPTEESRADVMIRYGYHDEL